MQITGEHTYPYSVGTVLQTLADPHHIQGKHRFLGARAVRVYQSTLSDDSFNLELSREVPAEVPQMFRSLIAEWNEVRQTEHWQRQQDGSWTAEMTFRLHGLPVELSGTQSLCMENGQTVHRVTMQLKCRVPVIGHKLAGFIAVRIRDTLRGEFAYTENDLREHAGRF